MDANTEIDIDMDGNVGVSVDVDIEVNVDVDIDVEGIIEQFLLQCWLNSWIKGRSKLWILQQPVIMCCLLSITACFRVQSVQLPAIVGFLAFQVCHTPGACLRDSCCLM